MRKIVYSFSKTYLLSNTLQIYTFFYNLQNLTTKYLDYLVNRD